MRGSLLLTHDLSGATCRWLSGSPVLNNATKKVSENKTWLGSGAHRWCQLLARDLVGSSLK